jgi:hypothetical protein
LYRYKEGRILTGHEAFLKRIGSCFAKFVDEKVKACQEKCREDLLSTTQFVTWSLHSGNRSGLASVLAPQKQRQEEEAAERQQARGGEYPDRGRHAHYDDETPHGMGGVDYADENGRASDNGRGGGSRSGRGDGRDRNHRGDERRGDERSYGGGGGGGGKGKAVMVSPADDKKTGSAKVGLHKL